MKKLIAISILICLLCLSFSSCIIPQKQFAHSLKKGRYMADEAFMVGNLKITYFELELTDGNMMQYVKTDGESMIKDLFTVNEKFQTVLCVNLTMCINGVKESFLFESAKALNSKTETEYKLRGLKTTSNSLKKYEELADLVMTTLDDNKDGAAEKLKIEIGDTTFTALNNDIPYKFTLEDEKGLFGTKGTVETIYYDYQTVKLQIERVVSYDNKYLMPVITLDNGEVIKPVLDKNGGSVERWLYSFSMPAADIVGYVSEIEVDRSEFE